MLASSAKVLIRIPVIIDARRSQLEDSLGTQPRPAHTGLFHAVLDQMTARAFDDAATCGPVRHWHGYGRLPAERPLSR